MEGLCHAALHLHSIDLHDFPPTMPASVVDHATPTTSKTKSCWAKLINIFRHQRRDERRHSRTNGERLQYDGAGYDIPDDWANLDEIAAPAPIENRDENARVYRHRTLEEER